MWRRTLFSHSEHLIAFDDAASYLLDRGLIEREWIIDGALTVRCASRRNRNLRVEGPGGAGHLIKQPDGPEAGRAQTLRSEADFYRFCQAEGAVEVMSRIVPYLAYFDPERSLLALRLIPEARPLGAYIKDRDAPRLSDEAARAFGYALGSVHRVFRRPGLSDDPRLARLGSALPWVMMIHRPGPDLLASLSTANLQAIRVLQGEEGLATRLDALTDRWRIETVIHGDIKLDNVLAWSAEEDSAWHVRIVDWEMVQRGDPAWDLAGALQDLLWAWVGSMPFAADLTIEERIARAAYPLEDLQGAIRSLWDGYRQAATDAPSSGADELLDRAVEFSGARMIQTAYELSCQASELSPQSLVLFQIATNILSAPEPARLRLYGLPMSLPLR